MKAKFYLFIAVVFSTLAVSARGDTLALWTFESPNVPPTVTNGTITGLLPTVGTGVGSGFHTNNSTVFTTAVGNGSANSLSANHWGPAEYWQFSTSTLGYQNIKLSYDQTSTAFGGPTNFNLLVSVNGTDFTSAVQNYTVRQNSSGVGGGGGIWNATTSYPLYNETVDLSSCSWLNDASTVYFRLVDNNLAVSQTATSQIDNFLITATAVPEPAAAGMVALAAVMAIRRRGCTLLKLPG